MRRNLQLAAALLIICLLSGCTSIPENQAEARSGKWYLQDAPGTELIADESITPSISLKTYRNEAYPVIYHLLTVDLTDDSLAVTVSPAEADGGATVRPEFTRSFAARTDSIVAVNGTPFSTTSLIPLFSWLRPEGVLVSDGTMLAPPVPRYGAVAFSGSRKVTLLESQAEPLPEDTVSAAGGYWIILKDGEHAGSFKDIRDSRTALGTDADGMTLYLLIVEGEHHAESAGLSFRACAEILLKAGATDALQLDGGSSSALIVKGSSALSYAQAKPVAVSIGLTLLTK